MALIHDELKVRNSVVKNRIVFPPIVVFHAEDDGHVVDWHVSHYRKRAEGGCGIVIVEATAVQRKGRLNSSQLGIWDDECIAGLSRIAKACSDNGVLALIQIHHAGLKATREVTEDRVSASQYGDGGKSARAMTLEEIGNTKTAFVDAAVRAQKAGFDGVELHGAHAYLLSQFASSVVNRRSDHYGGNPENRTRLAKEIITDIRRSVSADFIIGYRMGCNEPDLDDGIEIARMLEEYGVDLLHISAGFGGTPEPEAPKDFPENWIVWGGTVIRKQVKVPVITVNGIRTHEQANWLLDGRSDFVALARALLVDPDWPLKAKSGEEIVTCMECKPRCKWFGDPESCPRFDKAWLPV
ncbi:MAG: NADH:flavin oxidoreductase [Spirochaetales bacterium]|nr:NADH:flavin oxidoreductase [Spirochaetales bacterium]